MRRQTRKNSGMFAAWLNGMILAGAIVSSPALGLAATGTFATKDFNVASGDWGVASNWSGQDGGVNYVPGASANYYNDARIGSGRVVTVGTDLHSYSSQLRSALINDGQLNVTSTGWLGVGGVSVGGPSSLDLAGTIDAGSASVGGDMAIHPNSILNLSSQWQFAVGGAGTVNFTGGTVTDTGTIGGWKVAGTVNHSGGSSFMSRSLEITGQYNLSGSGTVKTGGSVSMGMLTSPNTYGDGALNMTGGTLTVGGALMVLVYDASDIGNSAATFSGGITTVAAGSRIGNPGGTGTGTLSVVGKQADITISKGLSNGTSGLDANNQNAPLILWGKGILHFVVGQNGVSTLKLTSTSPGDGRSVSYLAGILDMDLANGFTPAPNTTYDLVTTSVTGSYQGFTGLNPTGLTLADEDDTNWSYAVVSANGWTTLQATYVPEPGTMASALAIGGLALMRRRRG